MAEKFAEQEQEQKQVESEERSCASEQRDPAVEDIRSEESTATPSEAWKDNLVKKLTFNEVDRLARLLDEESYVLRSWYHLARLLGFTEKDINAMRRDGTIEWHHAKDFLDYFQKANQEATVKDFMRVFFEMRRNDIRELLGRIDLESYTKICDLPEDIIDEVADKLYSKSGIVKDWKSLAWHFGMYEEIGWITSGRAPEASYSPTHSLFRMIKASEKRELTFGDLSKDLEVLCRNDVVEILKNISESLMESKSHSM